MSSIALELSNLSVGRSASDASPLLGEKASGSLVWQLASAVSVRAFGYDPHSFRFTPGRTPMSTVPEVIAAVATYYAVIFGGRIFMADRKPFRPKAVFCAYNLALTTVSAILLVLTLSEAIPMVLRKGAFYSICNDSAWTQELEFLYYVCQRMERV
jgi:fatty acid elongase 3